MSYNNESWLEPRSLHLHFTTSSFGVEELFPEQEGMELLQYWLSLCTFIQQLKWRYVYY